jgi:glycosyltransferase involved in cell wall biosynthesis
MIAAIEHAVKPRRFKPKADRMLEVMVITHFYGSHGGGIELVAERLIQEISSEGNIHFTWAASSTDPSPIIDGQHMLPMRAFNGTEKILGIPWPIWSTGSIRRMRQYIQKADVIWLHDTLYMGNILAFMAAKKAKKPIIIAQHIAPIPYKNPLLKWTMHLADRLISSNMLKNADEVVFISDRVAEDYYQRVRFTRPIKVIPNGVDVRIFHPAIAENRRFLRQQFALKSEQPVLLFVGRFVEKKGLDIIRRLAKQLPEWRFWLAGYGRINPDKWLLPNIHVFKNRKGTSLAELYQSADLLLIPSYGEGFPLVIQEAMACGLPVLCGPSTAQGNTLAMPHLYVADVIPNEPEKTAQIWLEKLLHFPVPLPLKKPQESIAEFALASWDWPPIARVYADILRKMPKT